MDHIQCSDCVTDKRIIILVFKSGQFVVLLCYIVILYYIVIICIGCHDRSWLQCCEFETVGEMSGSLLSGAQQLSAAYDSQVVPDSKKDRRGNRGAAFHMVSYLHHVLGI